MVIGVLLFSLVMVVFSTAYVDIATDYGVEVEVVNPDDFDKIAEVDSSVEDIREKVLDKNNTFTISDTFNVFVKSGFTASRIAVALLPQTVSLMTASQTFIQFPVIFVTVFFIIIVVGIIFALVNAIMKWRVG